MVMRVGWALVLGFCMSWAQAADSARQGVVMALGGSVRFDNQAVWTRLVQEAGGKGARFAVFATAAGNPDRTAQRLKATLEQYGAVAEIVPVAPRLKGVDWKATRDDPKWVERVAAMDAVFFSGGSQGLIVDALQPEGQASPMLQAIRRVQQRGGVIAGTSAGAAIMSAWMFRNAPDTLAVLRGQLRDGQEVDRGLGFVGADLFVDQHFLRRGRIGRLLPLMHAKGYRWGLGIEEDSAALIAGNQIEVVGARGALLVDLSRAERDKRLEPFNLRGARVSFLDRGDRHDLSTGVTTPSAAKLTDQRIDPNASDFKPYFDQDPFFPDILGDNVLVRAIVQLVDGPTRELRGIAFNGTELRALPAPPPGRRAKPEPTPEEMGFEFRLHILPDTIAYYTGALGGEDYTVLRVGLDVLPVRMTAPIYQAWPPVKSPQRKNAPPERIRRAQGPENPRG
ncbi:cyanophycinase [Inhella gelatinilytica]|uniref:Type 1 glutamine amidotransferase-like domain-containing protein n=1 Tax=Inhella gelatinilytica TaxID=2795030 RepID=A0A931IWE5_9BURK|nr:cyanophycinase [Inhella gelatinilytica]MBH9552806.1 Type 1 glutamine amidotransferase-like domain-containing protein [Inhella gelatinilytica]